MNRSSKHLDFDQVIEPTINVQSEEPKWLRTLKLAWVPILLIVIVLISGVILFVVGKGQECPKTNLVGGVFCTHYYSRLIGPVPGLASFYGGMTFVHDDPNTLLVAGHADEPNGAIYSVGVIRDKNTKKITGFKEAIEFAKAPGIDSSILYDPYGRGIMFASVYPDHSILQFRPNSKTADYVIDLATAAPQIEPKIGALAVIPEGYPGAGKIWIASYDASSLSTASLLWDETDLAYKLTDIENHGPILPPGTEGFFFPPLGSAHLTNRILVTSFDDGTLYAMELDHSGIPKPNYWGQSLHFLTGLYGIEGAALDPLTGDMLFSHQNGSIIVRVEGFINPSTTSAASSFLRENSIFLHFYGWIIEYLYSFYSSYY